MALKLVPRLNGTILSRFGLHLERTRPSSRQQSGSIQGGSSEPIEDLDHLRFRTSEWTYSAPLARIVGRPLFGYGPQSWHPYVASARELLHDIDTTHESSVLHRFFAIYKPPTIAEAYRLQHPGILDRVPAASLFDPWILRPPPFDDPMSGKYPKGSPLFGPINMEKELGEWRDLKRAVASILRYGYQPDSFPNGRIRVTVLRSMGEERYVVGHGQHRAAVLAAMGMERIEVGIYPTVPAVVDESEVELWPHVRSGFVGADTAMETLRRYFRRPEEDPALEIGAQCQDPYLTSRPTGSEVPARPTSAGQADE
jgi:hypothetical protein